METGSFDVDGTLTLSVELPTYHAMLDVLLERRRQNSLKDEGKFKHTCRDLEGILLEDKLAILVEEVGEVARAVMEYRRAADNDTNIGEKYTHIHKEVTQVCAVSFAWLESFEDLRTLTYEKGKQT